MKCSECGGTKFGEGAHEQKYVVDSIVFRVQSKADRCLKCGTLLVESKAMGLGELLAAGWLAAHNIVSGASFRFMRKALLFRANELADLFGVTSESISRWENGKLGVDRRVWFLLAEIVMDRIEENAEKRTSTLERLQSFRRAPPARKEVRIDARAHGAA